MTDRKLIESLRKSETKLVRYFAPAMLGAMAVLYVISGIRSLRACTKIASYQNLHLSDIFRRWTEGIDIQLSYSGVYLAAVDRLETGLLYFAASIIMTILLILLC